jgi:protein-arginine deiminase
MFNRALPSRRHGLLTLLGAALAACGSSDPPTLASADAGADVAIDRPPALPFVRLDVDADRNGAVDGTAAERAHRADWSTTAGAMFLANVDDDDSDHAIDALDDVVNGDEDALDLARIVLEASPITPVTATGAVSLVGPPAAAVRLFKHGADGAWTAFAPGADTLTGDELRAGVEFGIESTTFPSTAWDGSATVSVTVTDQGAPVGEDRVVLRVAPWVMGNSIAPTERTYVMAIPGRRPSQLFVADLEAVTEGDSMPLTEYDATDERYINPDDDRSGPDPWTQDIMEFGWTAMPGPGGAPRGMGVVLRSPPPSRWATRVTLDEVLAPNMGYVWKHSGAGLSAAYDQSLDSFGNLELIPPYHTETANFPLGRIMYDYTATRYSDPALRSFLDAQSVQGPPMRVDASWLLVGHVDELFSYVPAAGTRFGWKMLIAAPALSRQLLQDLVAADPANGEQLMFTGQSWYDVQPNGTVRRRAAQRSINDILGDADQMAFNQQVQAHVDVLRMQIQAETGLPDADIVEVPFLWERVDHGRALAYMPGTVNLLLYGHTAIIPRPHGPLIGGVDAVEADMTRRMTALGITARYAEQWDLLHSEEGEVHCGTNAFRSIPTDSFWWEVAR